MKTDEKAIRDALVMLRAYDEALMKNPEISIPSTIIHSKLTPIIWRLKSAINSKS